MNTEDIIPSKSDTKRQILYESLPRKQEQSNLQRQRVEWWSLGAGAQENGELWVHNSSYRISAQHTLETDGDDGTMTNKYT